MATDSRRHPTCATKLGSRDVAPSAFSRLPALVDRRLCVVERHGECLTSDESSRVPTAHVATRLGRIEAGTHSHSTSGRRLHSLTALGSEPRRYQRSSLTQPSLDSSAAATLTPARARRSSHLVSTSQKFKSAFPILAFPDLTTFSRRFILATTSPRPFLPLVVNSPIQDVPLTLPRRPGRPPQPPSQPNLRLSLSSRPPLAPPRLRAAHFRPTPRPTLRPGASRRHRQSTERLPTRPPDSSLPQPFAPVRTPIV